MHCTLSVLQVKEKEGYSTLQYNTQLLIGSWAILNFVFSTSTIGIQVFFFL